MRCTRRLRNSPSADHDTCVDLENSTLFVEDKLAVQGYETVVRSLGQISLDEEESKALIAALGEKLSADGSAPQVVS